MLSALWFGHSEKTSSHLVTKTEFFEDGSYRETLVPVEETGSGLGIRPHMRLGPGRGGVSVTPPVDSPNNPGHKPPVNDNNAPPVVVNPDPNPDPEPEPEPTGTWKTRLTFVNQTASEKTKQNHAMASIRTVMNNETTAFKNQILAHKSYYGGTGFYGSCSPCSSGCELGNIGNSVWNRIWNANETLLNTVDNEMDLTVEMYYADNGVVGYTYSNQNKIWANRKFHDGYLPNSVASNFFHEWLHKLGYGHSSASTNCRPYSVPYAVGYMMRDRCKKYN